MNTDNDSRPKRGRPISLNPSETIGLEKPQAGKKIELIVKNGIIRIAAKQFNNAEDITLAFTCKTDVFKFQYPKNLELCIEAITNTTYTVESTSKIEPDTSDAIMDWVIQLHIVRHETNLENRLIKFFRLLITRLGKRTSEGLLLEHTLSLSLIHI